MSWNSSVIYKIFTNRSSRDTAGFGLVELLVSISILTIVTAIILVRQNSFNGAVLLRSEAYEIALTARDVQLNAVGASGDISPGTFRSVLGLHFDTLNSQQYRIFRDADSDGFYDSGEEFGLQGNLDRAFEIRALRAVGDSISGTELSIVFVRPNYDARFFDAAGSEVNASSVEIDIARRGESGTGPGDVRTVEITATGQIVVQ
jgi:type II secretory pathway pseudopilin PulG